MKNKNASLSDRQTPLSYDNGNIFKRVLAATVALLAIVLMALNLAACTSFEPVDAIPVLTWHKVATHEIKEKYHKNNQWVNDLDEFKEQMEYLHENGYKTISLDEFYSWYKGEVEYDNKTVVITIDDGDIENYYNVLPVLKQYNFKATVFMVGDRVKESVDWDPQTGGANYLTEELIAKMEQEYPKFEIQSHTYGMHYEDKNGNKKVDQVDYATMEEDYRKMEKYNFDYIAYPYGQFNDNFKKLAKENDYKLGFAFRNYVKAQRTDDPYEIQRIKVAGGYSLEKFISLL